MVPNHAPKPGLLINEISKLFHDRMRKNSEDLGFQAGYRQILRFLAHEDGVTQIDIARDSHFTAPTVSVTLKKMEKEGLIQRRTDKNDTRCSRVFITEKGRALERKLFEKIMDCESVLASELSAEEEETLCRLLMKVRNSILSDMEREGGSLE